MHILTSECIRSCVLMIFPLAWRLHFKLSMHLALKGMMCRVLPARKFCRCFPTVDYCNEYHVVMQEGIEVMPLFTLVRMLAC